MKLLKESDLIQSSISYLRNELGFSRIDYEVPFNIGKSKARADIVVYKMEENEEKPYILVEIKLNDEIGKYAWVQAESFSKRLNTPYFAITNGIEWKWFKTGKIGESREINIDQIDIKATDQGKILIKDQKQFLKIFDRMKKVLNENEPFKSHKIHFELIKVLFIKLELEREFNEDYNLQKEPKNIINLFNDYYQSKLKKYSKLLNSELDETFFKINLNEQTILKLISILDEFKLIDEDIDESSNFYFPILDSRKKQMGFFFIPPELIQFMVNFINPKINDSILDPSCRNGEIILEIIKKFNNLRTSGHSDNEIRSSKIINGIENDPELYWLTCMNLIFQGFSTEGIFLSDALKLDDNNKFDIILNLPPFGNRNQFNHSNFRYNNIIIRYSEEAFLVKSIKLLKKSGRMGIILPDRVLTSSSAKNLRKYLKETMNILSIVSLPLNLFSHNNIKTSILFLEKKNDTNKQGSVFMVDFKSKPNLDFKSVLEDYNSFKEKNIEHGKISDNTFVINEDLIMKNDVLSTSYYNLEYLEIINLLKSLENHVKLKEIADISTGRRFKENKESSERNIPIIKIKNIIDGKISKKELNFIDINNSRTKLWPPETLIISRIGHKNKIAILPPDFPEYALDHNLIAIKTKENVLPKYLASFLNSKYGQIQLDSIKISAIIPYLNLANFKEIIIPLHSKKVQKEILKCKTDANIFLER